MDDSCILDWSVTVHEPENLFHSLGWANHMLLYATFSLQPLPYAFPPRSIMSSCVPRHS